MASRIRVINFTTMTTGPMVTPPPPTGAWDLETDWEPSFFKAKYPVHLQQMVFLIPRPLPYPFGWATPFDTNVAPFRKPRDRQAFVSTITYVFRPDVPFVTLATSTSASVGSSLLTFASTATITVGMYAYDLTTPSSLAASSKVVGKTATTVTINTLVAGAGVGSGDSIKFTY